MRVIGVDFTCRPERKKPIAWCEAEFDGRLQVLEVRELTSHAEFETMLNEGSWVGGFDFPFSMPDSAFESFGWTSWFEFLDAMRGYPDRKTWGAAIDPAKSRVGRRGRRHTDERHRAQSPQNAVNPPVAKMAYEGVPRLFDCGASMPPVCFRESERVALEAYPKCVAMDALGTRSPRYGKGGADRRSQVLERLTGLYGFTVSVPPQIQARAVEDEKADLLDGILCAVQAAWASTQPNFGIPTDPRVRREGWIVAP